MVKIAQETSLVPEHFSPLQSDPIGPVSHRVDLAIQSPTCQSRAVPPPPSCVFHAPEGGCVHRRSAALGLCRYQSHLLPLSGTFALPWSRFHRADHRSVSLCNHMLRTDCRQNSKRLPVAFLQLFTRPLGIFLSAGSHRAGPNRKSILLPDTFRRPR